jgi:hypothetical protein
LRLHINSATEQRIVLAAISKISRAEDITDDEIYRVTIDDLKNLGFMKKQLIEI